jgi:hypothetical protein
VKEELVNKAGRGNGEGEGSVEGGSKGNSLGAVEGEEGETQQTVWSLVEGGGDF